MNRHFPWRRHVVAILVNCLFWQPVVVFAGGVRVDPNGGNTRLDAAGNGVPVVDIATPNAKGLSHNTFRDYNVDERGLILNNATEKLQSTQLGGLIVGNPNLRDQAAKLIINEVNGGRSSRLAGYTEVAGRQANVVVANPYGITCDGCGFINSPRVTLTTGKPIIESGELDHFAVEQGQVAIEGLGLDATQVDRFDILTRAATLNAEIHARRLNLITGANDVDADNLATTPRAGRGEVPALAIDSSALGGMYADRISLVGTEAGVGVRLAGDMATNAGDLRIDVDGHLRMADAASRRRIAIDAASTTLAGETYAAEGIDSRSRDNLTLTGTLTSGDDIVLAAGRAITNGGTLSAGVTDDGQRRDGRLTLAAQRLDNHGKIDATTRIEADLDILDNTGDLLADELALTTHESLTNAGTMQGRNVSVDAGNRLANTGTLQGDRLTVSVATLANQGAGARLAANDSLHLDAETIANHGGTLLFGNGQDAWLEARVLDNEGGTLRVDDGSLRGHVAALSNRDGTLVADTLALDVGALANDDGLLSADRALALAVDDALSNRGGQVQVTRGDLQLGAGSLDNTGGVLLGENLGLSIDGALGNRAGQLLGEGLTLDAASLDNGDEGLIAAGAGGLDATFADTLGNAGGQIQAEGDIALSAGHLDNQHGTILGEGLTLRAAHLDNGDGEISGSDLTFVGASLANEAGRLIARQGTLHALMTGELDNRSGQLAGETLTLDAGTLANDAGLLSADRVLALAVDDELSNRGGQVQVTRGDLQLGAGSLDNAGGVLLGENLALTVEGALGNRAGQLLGESLTLDAASLDNGDEGLIAAGAGGLDATFADTLGNVGGQIQAEGDIALTAGHLDNQHGTILGEGLTLRAAHLDNGDGEISGSDLTFVGASLANDDGLLSADRALALTVGDELSNRGGQVQVTRGDLQLGAGSLDNTGGVLLGENLGLSIDGALGNRAGQLLGEALTLDAASLDNGDEGLIAAGVGGLDAIVTDTLGNAGGQIQAEGDIALSAGHLDNQHGTILGEGLTLRAAHLDNGDGEISGSDLTVAGTSLANEAGRLIARQGTLHATMTGELDNRAGQLAGETLTLDAGILANDAGLLSADRALALTVGGELSNRGGQVQVTRGDLQLGAGSLDNTGGVLLGENLALSIDGALGNRAGQLLGDSLGIIAGSLDNGDEGLIAAGVGGLDATFADTLGNAGGQIQAEGDIALSAGHLDNQHGTILGEGLTLRAARLDNRRGALLGEAGGLVATLNATSGTALDNRDGLIDVQGSDLQLTAKGGALNNRGGTLSAGRLGVDAKSLDNGGAGQVLAGTGGLILEAASLANQGGLLSAVGGVLRAAFTALDNRGGTLQGDAVSATGATLDNRDDGLIAALDGDTSLWLDQRLDNRHGRILAQDALLIDPPTIDNRGGQLAGQQVDLEAGILRNAAGLIEATGALRIDANTLDNVDGDLRALGGDRSSIAVAGILDNTRGRIALASDAVTLGAATLRNIKGSLTHAGDGRADLDVGTWQGSQGRLRGAGLGVISAHSIDGVGDWQFNRGLDLTLDERLTLGADERLASAGTLALDLTGLDNRGTIAANRALTLDLGGDITNRGRISTQGNLDVRGRNLTQHDGQLASGGTSTYRLGGTLDNLGRLTAIGNLDLQAGAIINRGTLGSQNDLRLVSGGIIDNLADTLLFAGGNLTLRGIKLLNRYGDIYSRGDLDFARNDNGVMANQLENRSGTIEAEGDITLRAKDFVNTKDRYADHLELADRSLAGSRYSVRKSHKEMQGGGGKGETSVTWEWVSDGTTIYYDYDLTEKRRTVITADSPQAHLVAGGDLHLFTDDLLNSNSVLAANGDIDIRTQTLRNLGAGEETVSQTRQYRSDTGDYENSSRVRYYLSESELNAMTAPEIADWNAQGGVDAQDQLLPVPEFLANSNAQLISTVTTHTPLAGSEKAVISAGGRVAIHASERIDNGELQEHQRRQLNGQLGEADTMGLLDTLTVTLDRQAGEVTPTSRRDAAAPERNAVNRRNTLEPTGRQATALDARGDYRQSSSSSERNAVSRRDTLEPAGGQATALDARGDYRRIAPTQQSSFRLPQGRYGMFVRATSPQSHYLIETNPEFTQVDEVRGSDYLLDKLGYSDDSAYQLLGDGRYESRLVRDAVLANTGQRYLDGENDDAAQFRDLMDNAVASRQALDLEVGVGLTADQTAALTHDIVWLENQVVDGRNVLVPVLYLAQVDERDVRGNSLIRGRDIELIAGSDLTNVGTISASDNLSATSRGSILQGGLVEAGERLELTARDSLRNAMAGEIRGGQVSLNAIKGDIVNDRLAATVGDARTHATYLDAGATIEARDTLALSAGRDLVNRAQVSSGGDATFTAARDLINDAVEDRQRQARHAQITTATDSQRALGASIQVGGNASVAVGRDVAFTGSMLGSDGDLDIQAGRDIRIAAAEERSQTWLSRNGRFFNTAYRDESVTQQGSELSAGGNTKLAAGRDLRLVASDVTSGGDLSVDAQRDIHLEAAVDRQTHTEKVRRKTTTTETLTQQGSRLSAGGDLAIAADGDTTLVASHASAGDSLAIDTGGDLSLLAAANESAYEKKGHNMQRIVRHVRQQGSSLDAGDDLSASAGNDINLVASQARADDAAYLFAGRDVNLLAASDQDYSLYEKEKDGGLFGSSSYRRDEVDDRRAVGSQIVGGDGLSVFSGGDQTYQGARLESGGDLALTSLGSIDFATASDLHSESHEKSSGNFAWQSSKGEGRTDETLRQSELIARGETLIRAANGLNIDVSHIDQQTVSQTIDAMVAADPDLAWLKDMEDRGDVDWHQVKAIHDSWDYSQSGLGAGAALAISIAAVAIVGPAAAGMVGTTTTTAGAMAAAAVGAGAASLAATGAVSLINNRGDLGATFDDTLSSESLKGALIAAASAGAAQGLDTVWGGTTDIANGQTTGFDLSDWSDTGRFVGQRASQAVVDAGLQTAIAGGEFDEHLRQTLQGAASTVLEATLFNQVGDLGARYPELLADGEGGKIALHALAGGLAAEATGGDFRTGAAAAGANEALVKQLDTLVDRDPQLLVAASKLTGLMAAGLVDGDVAQGAEIAGNATTYNYLSHWQEAKKDEELAGCKDKTTCKIGTTVKWAMVDAQQEAGLLVGSAGGIALSAKEAAEGVYALVTDFPEVMDGLKQLATSPEFRQQFGENYLNDLQVRADRLAEAYETAGWDGSITAGVEGGRFAAELVGVLTAVKGGAQLIAKLPSSAGKLVEAARPSPGSDSLGSLGSQATKGRAIAEYGPLHKGPLPAGIANTFRSGTYREVVTTEATTLYRVMGDKGKTAGGYWTQTKPAGPLQSVIDSALDQNWGNTATRVVEMDVPVGTRIFEGVAAPQRGLVGGGNQVYFDRVINPLDPSWIKQ
ncbi:two-partner secretion domain-containing protein [Modicisalibacter radicis]|uniref:two-partner secretion domain-containing protein n=1 Tax=Halomonas sp. EAR18 TaxID=2518972 RepID=UPI00109CACC5|nr:DUF637 domain-containing protein [Halomonas sp. EAR18]